MSGVMNREVLTLKVVSTTDSSSTPFSLASFIKIIIAPKNFSSFILIH